MGQFGIFSSTRSQVVLLVIFSGLLVAYLFGQNLLAEWWIIDDHEIMWVLGDADHLPIAQILPKLMQTEVAPQATLPRFRPTYYALRLAEAWAWGKRPGYWYAFRLGIILSFVVTIWLKGRAKVGFIASGLVAAYAITFRFWGDIFARLGSSETYATLGLAFSVAGFDEVYQSGGSKTGWLWLLVGTILAAGSKENFVLLIVPTLFLLGRCWLRRTADWAAWLSAVLSLLWCAWIATVVIIRAAQLGTDIYGNSIAAGDRLHILLLGFRNPGILPLFGMAGLFLLMWILWTRRRVASAARASRYAAIWTAASIGLYLSQVVFYDGAWPTGGRYDLPGMLCWPLMLFLVIWYARQLDVLLPPRSVYHSIIAIGVVLLGLLALAGNSREIVAIRQASESNARRTTRFMAALASLSALAAEHPDSPILVQSDDVGDYEPLLSYPRFLSAQGVSNDRFLLWKPLAHEASAFRRMLSAGLADVSLRGQPGGYLPIGRLKGSHEKCILVVLAGPPRVPCDIQVDGSWRGY